MILSIDIFNWQFRMQFIDSFIALHGNYTILLLLVGMEREYIYIYIPSIMYGYGRFYPLSWLRVVILRQFYASVDQSQILSQL